MTTDLWCLVFLALWTLPLIYAVPFGKMTKGSATLSEGLAWGFGNRDNDPPSVPAWVGRAERAARNHFENLPVFAILVLVLHVTGKHDDVTAGAAVVYCVGRVLHALLYWSGVTVLGARTGAYYIALGALFVMLSLDLIANRAGAAAVGVGCDLLCVAFSRRSRRSCSQPAPRRRPRPQQLRRRRHDDRCSRQRSTPTSNRRAAR